MLIDQDGRQFRLSDTDGNVRVLYFGYTSCPDICPTTVWKWKDHQAQPRPRRR